MLCESQNMKKGAIYLADFYLLHKTETFDILEIILLLCHRWQTDKSKLLTTKSAAEFLIFFCLTFVLNKTHNKQVHLFILMTSPSVKKFS